MKEEEPLEKGPGSVQTPPRIAERVKFWQEQDRINKALIPRVLRIHELTTSCAKTIEGVTGQIATLDARLTRRLNDGLEELRSDIARLSKESEQLGTELHHTSDRTHSVQARVKAAEQQLGSAVERIKDLGELVSSFGIQNLRRSVSRLRTWAIVIAGLACLIAIISLIVSFLGKAS